MRTELEVIRRGAVGEPRSTPLLFVHGAWHAAWCWEEFFLDHFPGLGYEVAALSLRGHGGSASDRSLRRHRIADYVADVAAVAAELPAPPVVIGHSMGGYVVQHYLARHPAAAGVLLASAPPGGVWRTTLRTLVRHPLRFLWANLSLSLYPLVNTPALARELFYSESVAEADVQRWAARLGDESFLAFLDMLLLDRPDPGAVQVPLRVLGGERDAVFHAPEVEATAAAYGTRARLFAGAGHNLMLEPCWPEVADDIDAWIRSGFAPDPEAG